MPLKARRNNTDFFSWNLKETNRNDNFYCSFCDDELIPVLPKKNIVKHFRHKNNKAHGEPETKAHIRLKKTIYNLLLDHNNFHKTKLEATFSSNEVSNFQIADLFSLINEGEGRIVVECQCSPISSKKFYQRSSDYRLKMPTEIFWIFGGKYWEKTQTYSKHQYGQSFGSYKYQTISEVEKTILESKFPLIYHNYESSIFYKGDFEFKWKRGGGICKRKGWYDLEPIESSKIPNLILKSVRRKKINEF